MLIKSLYLFFLILFTSNISFGQGKKEDSLNTIKYFNLFDKFEYEDFELAKIYIDSALFFAKKNGNDDLLGDAYIYKGWRLQDQAQFRKSNDQFQLALKHFEKAGNKQGMANAYGNIGNSFFDIGEFEKSLKFQTLSKDINKEILRGNITDKELVAALRGRTYAMHNISSIYFEIGMLDKALEIELLSLRNEEEAQNIEGIGISLGTLGKFYKTKGDTKKAKIYFDKAIDLYNSDKLYDAYGEAEALKEYATLEGDDISEKDRNEMFLKALSFYRDLGDVEEEASTLLGFTDFYFDDLTSDSLSRLLLSVDYLITSNDLNSLEDEYYMLKSKLDYKTGKFKSASDNLFNYIELEKALNQKYRTQDVIVGGVRNQLEMKNYNDSLIAQSEFNKELSDQNEELARVQNIVYISIIGFLIVAVSLGFYMNSNRKKKRINDVLSEKNELIKEQKEVVDEKNASISDSINYAKRLQSAILPTAAQVNQYLPDSFLFFKPKDVVSGDFHWFEMKNGIALIAVADCTGHGVPGAMISVVCSNALNRVVNEFEIVEPAKVLDKTRELVIETFAKSEENVVDGMDIALCAIDLKSKKVIFSGANNPIWIVREGDNFDESEFDSIYEKDNINLLEIKADKQPVGFYIHQKNFTQTEIQLLDGDIIYLFTDGFADQFGGEKGKKFKYKPFKNALIEINDLSMMKQKEQLKSIFNEWKGELDQVDDVCIIGFKL